MHAKRNKPSAIINFFAQPKEFGGDSTSKRKFTMTTFKQPEDARSRVENAIEKLQDIQVELEAEKTIAHAKGHISGLRYNDLIEHKDFKEMDEALDKALNDWHWKNDKL